MIELAAALLMASAPAIASLMVVGCWDLHGIDVPSLYLGSSKSLLEPMVLGRVVANSTGRYFGSDFGCKSVYRYMDYDVGLYRPCVCVFDSNRCMCTDTEFD